MAIALQTYRETGAGSTLRTRCGQKAVANTLIHSSLERTSGFLFFL
jgi:hypothetical protein